MNWESGELLFSGPLKLRLLVWFGVFSLTALMPVDAWSQARPFRLLEATIEDIHDAYQSNRLTSRQLVQLYLDRIEAYDQKGPAINSIITLRSQALEEADRLDAAFRTTGFVGPLHGIPVIIKDQVDVQGTPTTLGSVLLKDYYPDKDAFVVDKLRKAGAIILAKATLGEFGGGDTHGSLFGSTRNPYALDRTAGGSSGGSGASIAANFATVAVGQEGFASIRRPSAWNSLVGMRPTAGLVSRTGVYAGWPSTNGSLGPMTRTVQDMVALLDAMVGYDPEDPLTASGVGHVSGSFTQFLDRDGLQGARIGILRESMGYESEPESEDFRTVTEAFDRAVGELRQAGAEIVDPVVIPDLKDLLATRAGGPDVEESFRLFFGRNRGAPFQSLRELVQSPDFAQLHPIAQRRLGNSEPDETRHYQYLRAREALMSNLLKVMSDHRLDAIVHKSVEHQPTLIRQGVNPPYVTQKGVPHINTFLVFVPTVTVPAGFTRDDLPIGISFLGRPYGDGAMIRLAYSYEQATRHRKPPASTPPLPGQP